MRLFARPGCSILELQISMFVSKQRGAQRIEEATCKGCTTFLASRAVRRRASEPLSASEHQSAMEMSGTLITHENVSKKSKTIFVACFDHFHG